MKQMTKFKLAQKRNYFKYVVLGLLKPIDTDALSPFEKEQWNIISKARETILENFDNTSRQNGLNVVEPCWCGKRRKTFCGHEECQKEKRTNKKSLKE